MNQSHCSKCGSATSPKLYKVKVMGTMNVYATSEENATKDLEKEGWTVTGIYCPSLMKNKDFEKSLKEEMQKSES
jgi:hypothetical protein